MVWQFILIVITVNILCIGSILYAPSIVYNAPATTAAFQFAREAEKNDQKTPTELFFVGDIMLGRAVETRMREEGMAYPFMHMKDLLVSPDVTIGNFEGIVNETHTQTPSMTLQFSIRNEYLTLLKQSGFDILSLANNHSFDYGASALAYTRTLCKELDIVCGGTPAGFNTHSIHTYTVGEEDVTFVFLQATWSIPSDESLDELFKDIDGRSGTQIAYIHWGEEYILTHNASQETLAKKLIDRGVDAVIGHHPHVVQDIALYREKPIFYSLGNFIFDQYFSNDVQEGLAVRMSLEESRVVYTLVPITSRESQNQPQMMEGSDRERVIARILGPITGMDGVDIQRGTIAVSR